MSRLTRALSSCLPFKTKRESERYPYISSAGERGNPVKQPRPHNVYMDNVAAGAMETVGFMRRIPWK